MWRILKMHNVFLALKSTLIGIVDLSAYLKMHTWSMCLKCSIFRIMGQMGCFLWKEISLISNATIKMMLKENSHKMSFVIALLETWCMHKHGWDLMLFLQLRFLADTSQTRLWLLGYNWGDDEILDSNALASLHLN